MFEKYIPDAYAKSIFDVDINFFIKHNFKTILVDLDNTLDSYKANSPSTRVIMLKEALATHNIEMIIISNNKERRVNPYASKLGVRYLFSTRKPFTKRLLKFMNENNISKNETIVVGDQLVTDIRMAKKAKIFCLLCDPIVKEDQWTTHFNRLIDRPIRRHLKKHKLLKSWEVI